ncbi:MULTISPECIES: hypothetical protein [Paenibacillus]|nr:MULTISPECIES: hypothetical protein [Paenibacillus]
MEILNADKTAVPTGLVDPSILQLLGAFPPREIEITSSPRR